MYIYFVNFHWLTFSEPLKFKQFYALFFLCIKDTLKEKRVCITYTAKKLLKLKEFKVFFLRKPLTQGEKGI